MLPTVLPGQDRHGRAAASTAVAANEAFINHRIHSRRDPTSPHLPGTMGIYDREYYRHEQNPFALGSGTDRSMVVLLILANVALYVLNMFTGDWLQEQMTVEVQNLWQPWYWWRFLTAGFMHDPRNIGHILFNMLGLFIFGRGVEQVYGRSEFLRFYLAAVVVASVVWAAIAFAMGSSPYTGMLGASGAIAGVTILFAFNFRDATILLFFVIPMPAWVFATLFVLYDLFSAVGQTSGDGGDNVAYTAHLAGAAFAFIYYQRKWNFGRLTSKFSKSALLQRKPRLKVHEPNDREETPLQERVDAILEKIHREGESSLTREERRTLEDASRRYQRRKQ